MINILSYIGMSLQSEVCLWTLLGLVRTIFDATLFKVNANLKQVWQMSMPEELSRPVQRVLRTMISGIMLVQCFTVYVYLASYIVLLYPVFLEERPTLVLPWLLLAAIRKLLCELTSLALGLGTCVLLGPARPPCIKFLVIKVASIMPSFYMWMLLYSYYHVLKVASVFKSFPVVLPPSEHDYGLELAVRRRRTKSLLGEQQLRTSLIANLYNEHHPIVTTDVVNRKPEYSSRMTHGTDTSQEDLKEDISIMQVSTTSNRMIPDTSYEDWFGGEVMIHRDTDRILEQFGLMMLRIGAYLTRENADSNATSRQIFDSTSSTFERRKDTLDSAHIPADDNDPPPLVGSVNGRTASYLRDYPQIFMKKTDIPLPSDILSLASDDMMVSSQKHRSQTQHDNNKSTSTDPNVSDHHAFKHDESQLYAQKKNSKETAKKLQTSTSEKSVAFRELKNTLTLESKESKNSLKFIEEAVETGSDIQNSFVKDENKAQRKPSGQLEEEVDIKIEASSTSLLRRNQETNTSNISTSIDPKMRKSKKKDA